MNIPSQIKKDILDFFNSVDSGKVTQNQKDHVKLFDQLQSVFEVKMRLDNDRNYHHCDHFIIYLHPTKGIIDNPLTNDRYEDHDFVKSMGGIIWELFIVVSDVGPYFSYYWNIRESIGSGSERECNVIFKEGKDQVPSVIHEKYKLIIKCIVKNNYSIVNYDLLKHKIEWEDRVIGEDEIEGEIPTLNYLLFGGYAT